MAKLTAQDALSPILGTDISYFVSNPGGTPVSKKGTVDQAFTNRTITTPIISGAMLFDGSAPSFNLASNVLGVHAILPFSSTISVAASKQFDHIRLSRTDGSYNVFTIGSAGEVDGLNFQLQAASGSHATSILHGVVGAVSNAGPGTVKGAYGRAIAETGSTGVIVGGVFAAIPVSTSSTAWILQLAAGADYVDAAAYIHADNGVSANLNDGFVFDPKVRMEAGGAFLKAFQTAGHDGDFLNYATQVGGLLFKVDKDGVLSTSSYLEFTETSAPSTPAANKVRLYAKDKSGVSNLYFKDDGGTEHDLSATGGGGGDALTSNPLSQFAATTSAQLAGVITNETGSNLLVFNTSPTLVTPVLGVAAATSINKVTFMAPATGATLALIDGTTISGPSATTTLPGLSLANTFTAKQIIAPAVNTNALAVSGYSLTGSNTSSLIDLAGTWNTSGTPTLIKANVTNTASGSDSLLMDLQVGGSSKFSVSKGGAVTTPDVFTALGGNFTGSITVGPTATDLTLNSTGQITIGDLVNSYLRIDSDAQNIWHANPNAVIIDTTGIIEIGDAPSGSVRMKLTPASDLIEFYNAAGAINFGDLATLGSGTTFGVDSANSKFTFTSGVVAIGTATPDASALVTMSSIALGFLPPRMTTTQRDAISSPSEGLTVFNLTTHVPNYWTGSVWSAGAGGSNPFDDSTALVKGSADATKLLRFEVDGFTTGVTRVLTPPNADGTIAVLGTAQTWSANQTFGSGNLLATSPIFSTDITTPQVIGGASPGGDLLLMPTSHATLGLVQLGGASSSFPAFKILTGALRLVNANFSSGADMYANAFLTPNDTTPTTRIAADGLTSLADVAVRWSSSTSGLNSQDLSISRLGIGLAGIGTGAQGSFAGGLKLTNLTYAAGGLMSISSGTNQRAGNATLVGGTVTVSNTTVTANTVVILTRKTSGGTIGMAVNYTLSAGTSFTITSDNILDTSVYSYILIENP